MGCRYRKKIQEYLEHPTNDFKTHLKDCDECSKDVRIASVLNSAIKGLELSKREDQNKPSCPTDDELMSFVDEMLSQKRREEMLEHLSTCTKCRQEVYSLREMNRETEDIPLPEEKLKKSIVQKIVTWLEPIFSPRLSPVPIAAYSLVIVILAAIIWSAINPVSSYDAKAVRIALDENRQKIKFTAEPALRLFQMESQIKAKGKTALGLVNKEDSDVETLIGVAIYLETLNELLNLPNVSTTSRNELIAATLNRLTSCIEQNALLASYGQRINELSLRFKGHVGDEKELEALSKEINATATGEPQYRFYSDLGSYFYMVCKNVSAEKSDERLKSLLQLSKPLTKTLKSHTESKTGEGAQEVKQFLEALNYAKQSSDPVKSLEAKCDSLFEKY